MNSLEPPRPPFYIVNKGMLVIPTYIAGETPRLVCDVYYEWGNPNNDNTADHYYWVYAFEDGTEALAEYYRRFKA